MRILFFGDSFVNGYGDPEFRGWPGRVVAAAVARGRDVTAYNLGIRRDTSADVAARWRDESKRRLPPGEDNRLVFSFGANDAVVEHGSQRVEEGESVANLRTILSEAASLAPVLMVGPPPVSDPEVDARLGPLSQRFQAECEAMGVPYLETLTPLSASGVWAREAAAFDGVHPMAGGYAELAALVEGWAAWRAWIGA